MMPHELSVNNLTRFRWLSGLSDEAAQAFCTNADVNDPIYVHCARIVLHIVRKTSLPKGYGEDILRAFPPRKGVDTQPNKLLRDHVRTLSLYVADLREFSNDLAGLLVSNDIGFRIAAVFRLARTRDLLDDDCLRELSYSKEEKVRWAVAHILMVRQDPNRIEILARLLNDPVASVLEAAALAAAKINNGELNDLLASKEFFQPLAQVGDPRAHSYVETLAASDDPFDIQEAIALAHVYRDRTLLSRLWTKPDWNWDLREHAILFSVSQGLLDSEELNRILRQESLDNTARLVNEWPSNASGLDEVAKRLCGPRGQLPRLEDLKCGQVDAVEQVRNLSRSNMALMGAAMRILPAENAVSIARELLDSEDKNVRSSAVRVVTNHCLTALYPKVVELCLDPDKEVSNSAVKAVEYRRIPNGLYAIDTAIFAEGDNFRADLRVSMRYLTQALLEDCYGQEPQIPNQS